MTPKASAKSDTPLVHAHVTLDTAMIQMLDDYQFGNRIRTRSEALRNVIVFGFGTMGYQGAKSK